MKRSELFSEWYSKILSEWPLVVDLKSLSHADKDFKSYVVEKLMPLSDEIGDYHIDHKHDDVFRSLNWALTTTIHGAAKHVTKLNISDIREDYVRMAFDKQLLWWAKDSVKEGYELSDLAKIYLNASKN